MTLRSGRKHRRRHRPTRNLPRPFFTVLRYQHADFLRNSAVHLSFANPYFNTIARPDNSDLKALEQLLEDKYGNSSDSANPLYFMTIWTARASLARSRLLEHYCRLSSSKGSQQQQQPGDPQRNDESSVSHALRMLECDAKLLTSPLSRGYAWFVRLHFPMRLGSAWGGDGKTTTGSTRAGDGGTTDCVRHAG